MLHEELMHSYIKLDTENVGMIWKIQIAENTNTQVLSWVSSFVCLPYFPFIIKHPSLGQ